MSRPFYENGTFYVLDNYILIEFPTEQEAWEYYRERKQERAKKRSMCL